MGHVAVAEPLQDDPDVALRFGFVQKQLRIGRQVLVDLRGRPQKKRKENATSLVEARNAVESGSSNSDWSLKDNDIIFGQWESQKRLVIPSSTLHEGVLKNEVEGPTSTSLPRMQASMWCSVPSTHSTMHNRDVSSTNWPPFLLLPFTLFSDRSTFFVTLKLTCSAKATTTKWQELQ